ncbi:putative DnaJ like protein subfamily C member 21 [Hyaloscypha finlandica]|nr:putative DnaJ like protein subfamily C member 21 [Hyaloscypha finlandica]
MGAEQSSGRDPNAHASDAVKRCYYEVLGVERSATGDEIKKAYRRKALELHPDRNYGDVEAATTKFAEVQSAYEVLSDPQERAWYDSHRDSILRGDSGPTEDHFEHNVRLTSSADIVRLIGRFNASAPLTDAPNGFYGTLRETFARLAKEEAACDWEGLEVTDYPDFGTADEDYEEVVKPFYRVWINFTTKKTFSWKDAYRSADAPDRATRRLVDKENKRLRDEGIREFNDAVRSLVAFVRKRDPRYVPNSQSEADRQRLLREATAAQAARSRAANQAKLKEHITPAWAQTQQVEDDDQFSESEESEVEHIECVVCCKTFKSERQYETHEKSKKHTKAVQQLQREMRKENERLNLDNPTNGQPNSTASGPGSLDNNQEETKKDTKAPSSDHLPNGASDGQGEGHSAINTTAETISEQKHKVQVESASDTSDPPDVDDEYASRQDVESRRFDSISGKLAQGSLDDSTAATSAASDGDGSQKLGKAKLKRAKKKARQEQEDQERQEFRCAACNESFTSKTMLFRHIKEFNHAQPVAQVTKGRNKKR